HIPDEFQELVFSRETLGSTEFDGIIALPHAIYPITEETFIVVALLKKPILWNKNKVSIVIMLSLSMNESQYGANEIYHIITKILSQKVLQSKLLRCRNYEEMISLLGEYL
ncbi:MAG: PTS sugar transporter subunit IIA, partial [Erysipelotrichaceae bacterium]|nr:PTS sugar transporter subunit IIA [Erysipelotrichaceae bacterium]